MWSDSPGWRRGSGWMWVDGWNFVGMTDRQMAEWRGGSICVGMTDGWMDGRADCGFKVDGEEGVDGCGWGTWWIKWIVDTCYGSVEYL